MSDVSLQALVSTAAGRLAQARDVAALLDVREKASVAYDAAKTAARLAKTKDNVDEITRAAGRAQSDALQIEAAALARLANEYDAAQEAGEVARHGQRGKSSEEKEVRDGDLSLVHLSDIGLTKQDIHHARKIRDAELREPGIVARALEARFAKGDSPTRTFLRQVVRRGGSNAAVGNERNDNGRDDANLYQTPWVATACLVKLVDLTPTVWEPACGPGAIGTELSLAGHTVIASDKTDYSHDADGVVNPFWEAYGPQVFDFLTDDEAPAFVGGVAADIVTNPPYNSADAFVAQALNLANKAGVRHVAMLLRLNFLAGCGVARHLSLDLIPPARVLVFSRRLPMMHREDYDGDKASSRMDCAWFVWDLDQYRRSPESAPGGGSGDGREAANGGARLERIDWQHCLGLSDEQAKACRDGADRATVMTGGGAGPWAAQEEGGGAGPWAAQEEGEGAGPWAAQEEGEGSEGAGEARDGGAKKAGGAGTADTKEVS